MSITSPFRAAADEIVGGGSKVERMLMVAFHYPPCVGSSGIHRTLKFSRYLPGHGWQPIVLTANPRAYTKTSPQQVAEVPAGVLVRRAFALDTARHVPLLGSTVRARALPDRWGSWWLGAVPVGLRLIRKLRPAILWSTYPVATAHLIALTLHRLTGLPWVADFRDPMTEDVYPFDARTRRIYRWIERQTVRVASGLVFVTPSARRMYHARYPELSPEQSIVIPNGYDEADFCDLPTEAGRRSNTVGPIRLVHAGLIYEEERDPRQFFRALSKLRRDGQIDPATLRVELRAPGSDAYYRGLTAELGLADIVHVLPSLPYREALRDCAEATGLIILQGESCNHQIPAKAYEYLRLGKPILALTTAAGDTARLLAECGGATVVNLHDEEAIRGALPEFLMSLRAGTHLLPDPVETSRYARQNQARQLAGYLSKIGRRSAR